ncbi:uncharacterized protein LODBEIA_P60660 [Lodderomyces beijingensis]|uniref:Transcription elongation factor Spt6 n=1 Tax=Lodderomyces beijingensis TaxID=1775926 RepID=A0ABP0ZVW9_9ASCO
MSAEEPEIDNRLDEQSQSEGEGDDLRNESATDSSEEDDDEEDEEAIQKVREGFIVDDEEDAVETTRRKKHRKRRREREREREEADALDEDDLELLRENRGEKPSRSQKFKRLKRRHEPEEAQDGGDFGAAEENREEHFRKGLHNMFSEDENSEGEDLDDVDGIPQDDVDDFIESEDDSDVDAETRAEKKREKQRQRQRERKLDTSKLTDVDRKSLEELFEVFGNGEEYAWALEAQAEAMDDEGEKEEPTTLEAVFENSELKERMLTEEDNLVRIIDVPERYQRYRSALTYIDLDDEELDREKEWVADIVFNEKRGSFNEYEKEFKQAVSEVVELVARQSFEVPFIWANRRDATLFFDTSPESEREQVVRLLYEEDLWRIVQLDLEYHSLYEKRLNIEKMIEKAGIEDDLTKDIRSLNTMVAVQDIYDYIQFNFTKEIRESETAESEEKETKEGKGKKHSKFATFERIRSNILYDGVKAYGISAKDFGENVQHQSLNGFATDFRLHATDDPMDTPEAIVEALTDDVDVIFKDKRTARDAIRKTFAEEIFHNPKIRQEVRSVYKLYASVGIALTDKGRTAIDNYSPYADIKYAINRTPADLVQHPDQFLRMLEAEEKGLAVVTVETEHFESWFDSIFKCLKSDGFSDISDAWNKEREHVLRMAFQRLCSMVAANTKEDLRRECQRLIAREVKKRFAAKLDQAPFKPEGFDKGTVPSVLSLTFGRGEYDSAVVGALVKDSGQARDFFKSSNNPSSSRENEEAFEGELKEFFDRNLANDRPDVIIVSGFNANTKKLYDIVKNFVQNHGVIVNTEGVVFRDGEEPPLLKTIWGQDETARLYQNSERARLAYPEKPPLVRYAIGVAKYAQNPLLEYISMGDDILSLAFHRDQKYIPKDMVKDALESAYVDAVNSIGVDINAAMRDPYLAQMLQYVAGFGPRKASGLFRNMESKLIPGLATRQDLIELELTPLNIFQNCASFLKIPYDEGATVSASSIELLDATRIHPEDYNLALKLAADVLELDEEDIDEEVIAKFNAKKDEKQHDIARLGLNDYGRQLERDIGKKKYATLRMIVRELVNNYEEIRGSFKILSDHEAFNLLTGETSRSFGRDAIVPVTIVKLGKNFEDPSSEVRWAKVVTSSLISGNIPRDRLRRDLEVEQGKSYQAVVLEVFYDAFTADLSLIPEDIKRASTPRIHKEQGKWDFRAEEEDWKKEHEKEKAKKALTRNIQHPLYRNFNYKQAEEYLAPQSLGDCVIRPSSKGPEYLTITWKVGNNLFQHLLMEERRRGGKTYIVEGKTYSDLDQVIVQHIQAISRKVDDLVRSPKFKEGTLAEVNDWLESYTKANPKNSAYVFCYDHKIPGSFLLLFKVNITTPIITWHVRTITDGYVLKGLTYNSVMNLCNGFKQTFKTLQQQKSKPAPQYNNYGYNY